MFCYKIAECGETSIANSYSYNSATFKSAWHSTDFALMEISHNLAGNSSLCWLGWDRTDFIPTSGYCIHHPCGDVMKINSISSSFSTSSWNGIDNHWYVNWDEGITQGGSSGAPFLNQDKRVVGQNHGKRYNQNNLPLCDRKRSDAGRFNLSWTGGGTNDTRLSNWLDPIGTGQTTTDSSHPIFISGPNEVYSASDFTLQNLPSAYTFTWSLTGDNASCFTLQSDTPSANQCTITRKPDAEFSGSASLTLTAQISYNGTVVNTLTKPLTALYISGDANPCTTEIYTVEDLPNNYIVTWDLSGLGYSVLSDVIPEGAQNNNYLGVQRTSQNSYASAIVTATLWSGSDVVGTLEKRIWSGASFAGTWYQSSSHSAPYLPEYTASELQCEIYTVDPNKTIVMQSDDFIGTLLTCNTDNGNVFVSHSINSSTASFYTNTANGHSFTVIGKKLGTCKVFRFKFLAVGAPEPDEPLMLGISATGHDYVFSLTEKQENTEEQQAARTIRNWKLNILHSETGQAIYEGLAESDAITVNTSGWKPGIYVAVANVNGKNIAQKLSVTR